MVRYYVKETPSTTDVFVMDRHNPNNIEVARCKDILFADLICDLLNESWNRYTQKETN